VPNQDAFGLLYDFQTLRELASDLPGDSALQSKALVTANNIMNVFQHDNPETIKKARKLAEGVFGVGWEAKKEHVYEEFRGREPVWGIGHCTGTFDPEYFI
jgi:alpha-mannosidase